MDWEIKTGGSSCGAGYESLPLITFPGIPTEDAGCGCMAGAQKRRSDTGLVDAESELTPCWTNQTDVSQYTCRQIGGVHDIAGNDWRGDTFCYKRGFKSAMDTPYPDKDGACPTGFHKCGSQSGTFDENRSFCASDNEGISACPVTWLGSTNVLSLYNLDSTELASGSACSETACTPVASANEATNGQYYYKQQGDSNVINLNTNNWSPLPLVEVVTAFQVTGDQGPCYGDQSLVENADKFSSTTQSFDGVFKANLPGTCEKADKRFMPINTWNANDYLQNKILLDTSGPCSDLPSATEADVFAGGSVCDNNSAGKWNKCASGKPVDTSCPSSDFLCRQAYTQTACGTLTSMPITSNVANPNVGLYMKAQIFWSETCPYTYEQVVKNNGPLQKAINWQTYLLYLNIGVNIFMILFGLYICYLCWKNRNSTLHVYYDLEHIWKPRAEFVSNWIKVPVVVLTIVFTGAVSSFFVKLDAEKCSDETTNSTFLQLAEALPGVITSNIVVLAVDVIGLVPVMYAWFVTKFCPPDPNAPKPPSLMTRAHAMCCGGFDGVDELNAKANEGIELIPGSGAVSNNSQENKYLDPNASPIIEYSEGNVNADGTPKSFGQGKITYSNGGVYVGYIFKNMRHNNGFMNYPDGTVYNGHFKDDKRDGTGTLIANNGKELYKGEWFQDNKV